jgi:hypothetical protein
MVQRKKQKTAHTTSNSSHSNASHSNASAEPIDLTFDTPPKLTKQEDDDLIITEVKPPPGVVITSYKPAENAQVTMLGLMANVFEKVNTHNSRFSPSKTGHASSSNQTRVPKISTKRPNNAPATVAPQESSPGPPTTLRCAICLSSFSVGIELSATICGHIFCQDCIGSALKQGKKVCPICRKDLKGKTAVHRLYI